MARQVEGKPVVAEGPGLKTCGIRHSHHKQPTWGKECCCMAQRMGGPAEVLKRMPEDNRSPGTAHVFDFSVANARSGCVRFQTDGVTAMAHEGVDQSSIASPHIENWTRWQYPLQPIGKRTARAPEHKISEACESASRRPIPGAVSLVKLRVAWPWRRCRHRAPCAPYSAGKADVSAVEPVTAPSALDGGRRRSTRIRQRVAGPSRRRSTTIPASV